MSDVSQATPPLANAPEARTPTGEIVDQAAPKATPETTTPTPTPSETKTEAKPADGKTLTSAATEKPAPSGAPEKYEAFKAPEGYEIDNDTLDKATPLFKDLGLSQDQAQKLVDLYADVSLKAAQAPFETYEKMRTDWRDAVVKDPAIGDGTGLRTEVKTTLGRAIDSLPPDVAREFRAAMDLTGAGDNPAFIKAFYNFAQRIGEGTSVRGSNPSSFGQRAPGAAPKSAAAALYPNLPSAT
jgi:hypothetical protein